MKKTLSCMFALNFSVFSRAFQLMYLKTIIMLKKKKTIIMYTCVHMHYACTITTHGSLCTVKNIFSLTNTKRH